MSWILTLLFSLYPAKGLELQPVGCEQYFTTDILDSEESLIEHGFDGVAALQPGEELGVLVWNIHKATRKGFWDDFKILAENSHLSLIQESILSEESWNHLHRLEQVNWRTAVSFRMGQARATGLSLGSRRRIENIRHLRSPTHEPFVKTPKLALVAELPIEGSEDTLMVVNIHALNFVRPQNFRRQLRELADEIREHQGPLLVAGDLNTHFFRDRALNDFVRRLNLEKVYFQGDRRWKALDHIFVRGLEWAAAEVVHSVRSSDHKPLRVRVRVPMS